MEDSWLDRWLLERFRRAHTSNFGKLSARPGYEGLVEEIREVMQTYNPDDFQQRIFQTYRAFFTTPVLSLLRMIARAAPRPGHSLLMRATPLAFQCLVGQSKPITQNQIHISRCKFAEQAGPEACLRACKLPTENFFREVLEVELHLKPDQSDLSCTAELTLLRDSHRQLQS